GVEPVQLGGEALEVAPAGGEDVAGAPVDDLPRGEAVITVGAGLPRIYDALPVGLDLADLRDESGLPLGARREDFADVGLGEVIGHRSRSWCDRLVELAHGVPAAG